MRKIISLVSPALLLLLAGCAKEIAGPEAKDGLQRVTFTATMAAETTRAAADGDGAAASVNRCVMEIYYNDSLFDRKYAPVTGKTATFSAQLVAGRSYSVAFWADCVADAGTDQGLAADLYYNTSSLKAITFSGDYAGNNDARDAFFAASDYTIAQSGGAFEATLTRPFAQVNVITTDWDKADKVAGLRPTVVNVTVKGPLTSFNALTGKASASVTALTYEAGIYTSASGGSTSATLSMDYLFASSEGAVIDIDWKAGQGTAASTVSHSFSNIPYRRNYRTNVKGSLLTTTGQWNVTVNPAWETAESEVKYASTLADAQSIVETGSVNPVTVNVGQEAVSNATTGDIVTIDGKKYLRFILKTSSPYVVGFVLPEITSSDYERLGADTWLVTYEPDYPTTSVTVDAPAGTKVKIEAPTSHVEVTGTAYAEVTASTGDNTLVIPAGTTVSSLIVNKGGLEIHGTVEAVSVVTSGSDRVYVRSCENLVKTVYDVLEPYIDVDNGYVGEKLSEDSYRIHQKGEEEKVARIGDVKYYTLNAAINAATDGQTVTLLDNVTLTSPLQIATGITLDLNGLTLTTSGMSAESAETRPINIKADNVVVRNGSVIGDGVSAGYALFNVHNPCTLQDVVISTPGVPVNIRAAVTVNIEGESTSITSTGDNSNRAYETAVFVSCGATLNISAGTFTGGTYAATIATSGGTINITGGSFNKGTSHTDWAGNHSSLLNDGTNSNAGYLNISGNPTIHGNVSGRVNGCTGHSDYLNISGGTFDGDCLLYNFEASRITLANGFETAEVGTVVATGYNKTNPGKYWTLSRLDKSNIPVTSISQLNTLLEKYTEEGSYVYNIPAGTFSGGTVTIRQRSGVSVSLCGSESGVTRLSQVKIVIDGMGGYGRAESVTIKNISFDFSSYTSSDEADVIYLTKNTLVSSKAQPHNITVEGCKFIGNSANMEKIIALKAPAGIDVTSNLAIRKCEAENLHSLAQLESTSDLTITDCTLDCGRGVNLQGSKNIVISGNTWTIRDYVIRAGQSSSDVSENKTSLKIYGNKFTKTSSEDSGCLVLRYDCPNEITFCDNTVTYDYTDGDKYDVFVKSTPKGTITVKTDNQNLNYSPSSGLDVVKGSWDKDTKTFTPAN